MHGCAHGQTLTVVLIAVLGLAAHAEAASAQDDRCVERPLAQSGTSDLIAGLKLEATPEAVTDASPKIVPGWFIHALAQEAEKSNTSTSLLNSRSSMVQQPTSARKRSWMGRHPMLFGTLVGLGGGFIIGTARSGDDYATTEIYGLMFGGIGAGVGAAAGAIVGLATR